MLMNKPDRSSPRFRHSRLSLGNSEPGHSSPLRTTRWACPEGSKVTGRVKRNIYLTFHPDMEASSFSQWGASESMRIVYLTCCFWYAVLVMILDSSSSDPAHTHTHTHRDQLGVTWWWWWWWWWWWRGSYRRTLRWPWARSPRRSSTHAPCPGPPTAGPRSACTASLASGCRSSSLAQTSPTLAVLAHIPLTKLALSALASTQPGTTHPTALNHQFTSLNPRFTSLNHAAPWKPPDETHSTVYLALNTRFRSPIDHFKPTKSVYL